MTCFVNRRQSEEAKKTWAGMLLLSFIMLACFFIFVSPALAFASDTIHDHDPGLTDIGGHITKWAYGVCTSLTSGIMGFATEFWNIIAKGQFIGGDLSAFPTVQDVVVKIIKQVVVPVAQGCLGFMLAFELLHIEHEMTNASSARNLGLGGFEQFIFFAVKYAALYVVLNNVYEIMYGIFAIFNYLTVKIQELISTNDLSSNSISADMFDSSFQALTYDQAGVMVLLVIVALVCLVVIAITCVYGQVLAISRIFEVFILITFSAIPLTTFANRTLNNIGIEFIKTFCGACLQLAVIYVIVGIGGPLISSVTGTVATIFHPSVDTGIQALLLSIAPIVSCIALYEMLKASRTLSQKVFGYAF